MTVTGEEEVTVSAGACGSWWGSLKHFDYLHKCVIKEGHEGRCRCACGKLPPKGQEADVERRKQLAKERRND